MGLFNKKSDLKKTSVSMDRPVGSPPRLPELPRLPDFPGMEEEPISLSELELPQLPSFPNNSLGDRFSQNTIKEAVAGEKEVEPEEADESEYEKEGMMREPLEEERPIKNFAQSAPIQKSYQGYSKPYTTQRKAEPVFIRLDKFEESLEVFNSAKEQISEIEHLLKNVKELKAREEEELNSWENRIQEIKKQIEKVDQDVFSKI